MAEYSFFDEKKYHRCVRKSQYYQNLHDDIQVLVDKHYDEMDVITHKTLLDLCQKCRNLRDSWVKDAVNEVDYG